MTRFLNLHSVYKLLTKLERDGWAHGLSQIWVPPTAQLSRAWPLQWRHNERDSVSNQQPRDCSLKRLFMRKSKKISKFRVTGLYEGNSPMVGEFPAKRASNAKNVSIWWRYHGIDSMVFITGLVHPRSRYNCSSYEQTFQFNKQYSLICHIKTGCMKRGGK